MQNAQQIFSDFVAHPNFHIGFLWKIRIQFFGVTQKELAAAAGIEAASLSNIIKGKVTPKRETIDSVEKAITQLTKRH